MQVIIPGSEGEYGVTVGHSPLVAELKPGVLQVLHEEASRAAVILVNIVLLVVCHGTRQRTFS